MLLRRTRPLWATLWSFPRGGGRRAPCPSRAGEGVSGPRASLPLGSSRDKEEDDDDASRDVPQSGFRARLDAVLSAIERPARDGFAFAKEAIVITATLAAATAQLLGETYRNYVHYRLRRLVRFAIGTPFLMCLVYLLTMMHYYMPEQPQRLDTSCVDGLPLCHTADDLVDLAYHTRKAYHQARRRSLAWRKKAAATAAGHREKEGGGTDTGTGGSADTTKTIAATDLTPAEQNEAMRGLFIILRSIEKVIIGTPEERALIEPRMDLLGPETAIRAAASGEVAAPSRTVSNTRPASPAEFALRVVLSIALEQGWFDIAECARDLYGELVRQAPTPTQARVVSAVGELCSLSYELERFSSGSELTLSQRRRFARAIDTFRPESAVEERSTIASEIAVLPLSDGDDSTRCLSLIRHSRGRRPQLIMCFIGSNSVLNWMTNFNYLTTPLPPSYGVGGGVRAHRGFLKLLDSISYHDVVGDFDEIILVGHSLGGALAQLAGLRLAAERPSRRITVITMASPRVLALSKSAVAQQRDSLAAAAVERDHAVAANTREATAPPAKEEDVVLPTVVLPPSPSSSAATDALGRGDGASVAATAPTPRVHVHDDEDVIGADSAVRLLLPRNYRHFRGYIRADVVPKLPPERVSGYTHVGGRIPLNTGCKTTAAFLGWGFWSALFHSSELYSRILRDPPVAQTHYYTHMQSAQEREEEQQLLMRKREMALEREV